MQQIYAEPFAASLEADHRANEYKALSTATTRMVQATQPGKPYTQLVHALEHNGRLWTTLMADVATEANALPPALRASILSLGGFVLRKTDDVLRGNRGGLTALVEINLILLKGLRGGA